jgi:hypothetical protein
MSQQEQGFLNPRKSLTGSKCQIFCVSLLLQHL